MTSVVPLVPHNQRGLQPLQIPKVVVKANICWDKQKEPTGTWHNLAMRSMTFTQLRIVWCLRQLEQWLEAGEQVELLYRKRVIAHFIPVAQQEQALTHTPAETESAS
jgi:hypothetical protein